MSLEPRDIPSDSADDPALREAFVALRRADANKLPPFTAKWKKRRSHRISAWWVAVPAVSVVAAAAAFVLWMGPRDESSRAPAPAANVMPASPAVGIRVRLEPDARCLRGPAFGGSCDPLGFLLEPPKATAMVDFDSNPTKKRWR